jgi:hypothetical protein
MLEVGMCIGQLRIEEIGEKKCLCQCLCGTRLYIPTYKLENNQVEHCGCKNRLQDDLTGRQFGDWSVIGYAGEQYYFCKCKCGTVKKIHGQELKLGRSQRCKRCSSDRLKTAEDITGKIFGNWEVLDGTNGTKIKCKCLLCGKVKEVVRYDILRSKSTSCGCKSTGFKDLTDREFGYWEVIDYAGNGMWNCKCNKCGNIRQVNGKNLLSGLTKSCSCGRKKLENAPEIKVDAIIGDFELLEKIDYTKWTCRCVNCYNIEEKECI